ncbi:MAG TPA: hypothetical protein PKD75_07195 [Tepidiformaceae bacterium]|nr:hypothetical protein [Tepidiformaceae bacterium]
MGHADVDEFIVRCARGAPRLEFGEKRIAKDDVVDRFAHDAVGLEFEGCLEEGDLEFLAFAGAFAVEEGGTDAHRGRQARRAVGHGGAGDGGGGAVFIGLGFGGHKAAVGLGDDVGAGTGGVGAGFAEAGDAGVDEPGIERAKGRVVDAHPRGDARAVVDEHDIERGDEAVDCRAPFGFRKVDGEAALAAVEGLEVLAFVGDDGGAVAPGFAFEWFDLDDVGAEIGEGHAGEGSGHDLGEFEDADARERSGGHARGNPRPRVAMTLRWTSEVPPRMVAGTMPM